MRERNTERNGSIPGSFEASNRTPATGRKLKRRSWKQNFYIREWRTRVGERGKGGKKGKNPIYIGSLMLEPQKRDGFPPMGKRILTQRSTCEGKEFERKRTRRKKEEKMCDSEFVG